MSSAIYITGLAYEVGEPSDIGELTELGGERQPLLEALRSQGLERFSMSISPPAALAAASAARTIWKSRVDPGTIEYLVYATSTFWHEPFYKKDINDLLSELKLTRAYPIGVTLSECGNAIAALRVASSLIRAEGCKNVLVITTDKIDPGKTRIVPPDISVASDAAASFMVSGTGPGQLEVLSVHNHMLPMTYASHPHEDFTRYLRVSSRGLRETGELAMEASGKRPSDFRWLLTNNYNLSVARFFSSETGFAPEQIYVDNISRHGHAFGADCLINLYDCMAKHPAEEGDLFLLLATGPNMWGAAVLKKT